METIPRGGLYNRTNPPPSHSDALARLNQLQLAIESINVQLETTNPNEFVSNKDFSGWKKDAVTAASHYRCEAKYLERWILGLDKSSGNGGAPQHLSNEQYRESFEKVVVIIEQMTTQMRALYEPMYAEESLPPDITSARKRMELLREISSKFHNLFESLRDQVQPIGISKRNMTALRRPMSELLDKLNAEARLVSAFIYEQGGGRVDWKMFMLSIIERATASGLVLSDEETGMLQIIRDTRRI